MIQPGLSTGNTLGFRLHLHPRTLILHFHCWFQVGALLRHPLFSNDNIRILCLEEDLHAVRILTIFDTKADERIMFRSPA